MIKHSRHLLVLSLAAMTQPALTLAQEADTLRLKAEITQERLALIKVKSGSRGR